MKLNSLLEYLIKEDIEEGIRNTSYAPTPFNIRDFKKLDNQNKIRDYVEDRLQMIGEGSSRTVFVLSPRFALKLANLDDDYDIDDENYYSSPASVKGKAQNEAEFNIYMKSKNSDIIPEVQDYHPDFLWIIAELVRPIKSWSEFHQLTGLDEFDITSITDEISTLLGDERDSEDDDGEVDEELMEHPLAKEMTNLASQHDVSTMDMRGLRQWGKASDGRVVLLDTGGTNEILDDLYETE